MLPNGSTTEAVTNPESPRLVTGSYSFAPIATHWKDFLKPGGLLVFLDSSQYGDRPDWDGVLESFPHRFHEPYYRHYLDDDLDGLFCEAGLLPQEQISILLSKLLVRRKVS